MLATYGLFYIMTTWIVTYAVQPETVGSLGYDYQSFLGLQIVSIVLFAIFIPIVSKLADRFGRRRMLITTTSGIIVFGLSFGLFIGPEVLGTGADMNVWQMFAFLSVGMALMGLTFGPMSAYLPELFPTNTRYTGSGWPTTCRPSSVQRRPAGGQLPGPELQGARCGLLSGVPGEA